MRPLLIKNIVERPVKLFPKKEIVCREPSGDFRYSYGELYPRLCKLANVLEDLGVKSGDVVGAFAWQSHRDLELDFAVPSMGAVLHVLNVESTREAIIYLLNEVGQDKALFIDERFVPLFEEMKDELKTIETYVVMTDKKELPKTKLPTVYSYDELMDKAPSDYTFPDDLDENSPALLHNTGGTTGLPKGVVHSHRSIFTHTCDFCFPDVLGLSSKDVVLMSIPIWYMNTWHLQYASALVGAKMVFPNYGPDAKEIGELIQQEKVTLMGSHYGFLTQWITNWEKEGYKYDFSSLRNIMCVGPALMSRPLLDGFIKRTGVKVTAGYGNVESCPVVSISFVQNDEWPEEKKIEKLLRTDGIVAPLVEWKVVNPKGGEVKHDGKEVGEFAYRGPHIIEEYYKNPEATAESFKQGWFYSGDMVSVDEEGYIRIRDRVQDMIKAEEEWLSPSILEDVLKDVPAVKEAAVVGIPRGEFEKPLACVVLKDEYKGRVSKEDILKEFEGKVPESWMPKEVVFIDEVPRGPTGKYMKAPLKEKYGGK